ncbi:MAG TPA: 3'-phosphoadenosine 5'-phosphosulfate sulfotransferase, partial [Euryarchaeota archaeon]|nr:3'-phosphoadenosine 5'-phosphosulfate sulfotransferase [Euryarchaeota archaeon]
MGAIRLGAKPLRWCHGCNLPILEERTCPICGGDTDEVNLTPPGDCRPAFIGDIQRIRSLADRQFGAGCGDLLLPEDRIAILNRCPSLDRMDEIVVDGDTLGAVIFDPPNREKIVLRPSGAARMLNAMTTGRVVADRGALPSISKGSNLMGPGVVSADETIQKDDDIVLLSESGEIIGTGLAKMSGREMSTRPR